MKKGEARQPLSAARGPLILFGDSHVRSYVDCRSITKVMFIGSGKDVNLSSNRALISLVARFIVLRITGVFRLLDSMIWVYGEPDVRWACFHSWHIEGVGIRASTQISADLKRSTIRFGFMLRLSRMLGICPSIIVGAGTPNPEMHDFCREFNAELERRLEDSGIAFFSPQSCFDRANDKHNFQGHSAFNSNTKDNVHFSTRISAEFDIFLKEHGFPVDDVNKREERSRFSFILWEGYLAELKSYRIFYNLGLRIFFSLFRKG